MITLLKVEGKTDENDNGEAGKNIQREKSFKMIKYGIFQVVSKKNKIGGTLPSKYGTVQYFTRYLLESLVAFL